MNLNGQIFILLKETPQGKVYVKEDSNFKISANSPIWILIESIVRPNIKAIEAYSLFIHAHRMTIHYLVKQHSYIDVITSKPTRQQRREKPA